MRNPDVDAKFCEELHLEALEKAIPTATIEAVLQAQGVQEQRQRKLNLRVVVLLCIAMNLFSHLSLGAVLGKLAQGLRLSWPDPEYPLPKDAAICYRRYQLGARPMVALFHRVCQPMATPNTPGAFLFGLRLMAIDGTVEDVPDTPENEAAFGRHHSDRGASAFPQVQGVYLVECGTHGIVDAGFWPCHTSERVGGFRMLRSVGPGMLVMWDRGFHDFDMIMRAWKQGAQVLSRLPAHVKPRLIRKLPDGSYLAYLYPSDPQRRKKGEHLVVRVIEYTITQPGIAGYGETHRLVTTLLDEQAAPALELACAYHERWEIELVIDEVDTHQRLAGRPLRSLKPVGVIQELYGLLIAHYAVRVLMHEAAVEAQVDPDRLSFVQALEVIRNAVPEFQMVDPSEWPRLYTRLLHDLVARRLPERRFRCNPRGVKRKMSKFPLKRPGQTPAPPPIPPFRQVVALI
jgi:hypothetical protein